MLVKIEQEGGVKSIKIAEASDGLNAYQLAVKNDGFVGDYDAWKVTFKGDEGKSAFEVWEVSNPGGTLEQYNAFIKGEAGYTPIKGTDYDDGYTPVKGVDYFDGDKGEKGDATGLKSYETKALLPTTGATNTSYKVTNDPTSSNNGYYHWSGSVYVKDANLANGVIEAGNLDAVSGDKVYNYVEPISIKPVSTLNVFDYSVENIINGYRSSTDGSLVLNSGYRTTSLISVHAAETAKYTGRTIGSAVRAVIGYDVNKNFHSILLGVIADDLEYKIMIPSGVKYIAYTANNSNPFSFTLERYLINGESVDLTTQLNEYYKSVDYQADINGVSSENIEDVIAFDWMGGGFAPTSNYNEFLLSVNTPVLDGLLKEITYKSNSPLTSVLSEIAIVGDNNGFPVTISTHLIEGIKTIGVDDVIKYELTTPVYVGNNQSIAIKANDVFYTNDPTTGVDSYYWDGSIWKISAANKGAFYNFKTVSFTGVKNRIFNIENEVTALNNVVIDVKGTETAVKRTKLKFQTCYDFNFSQPTTDWELNDFLITDGVATATTPSLLKLTKPFVSSKRIGRFLVTLKSDTVFKFGAYVSGVSIDSSFVINATTSKIEIYQRGGSATIIKQLDIATIIPDQEYYVEMERDGTNTIIRLINTVNSLIEEVSFDYGDGSNYNNGAGNHRPFYFFELVSGTSLSIKSFEVLGIYKPLVVFAGDSITDANGRCSKNFAETLLKDVGDDGCIVAKTGCSIANVIEYLNNEVFYIKPRFLSVTIGTNNITPSASEFQPIIDFCTTNNIELYLNNVPAKSTDDHLGKNITIKGLGVKGAKFDIATSLNYDITQGYDATIYNDITHPNQEGNDRMASRFRVDIPNLRIR